MRTKQTTQTDSKSEENVLEEEKQWKKFHSIYSPVRILIRASEETLKRQRKLVLFPLQKIVEEEEGLSAAKNEDQTVLKLIKKVIDDEEEIITQRQNYVLNPLSKLQEDIERERNISRTQNLWQTHN